MPHLSKLGLASSYGAGAREVEAAYERGVRFFFWGALRLPSFGAGIRRLPRENVVVAIQTFTHRGLLVRASVDAARLRLRTDRVDVLCLACRERGIEPRVLEAARALVDRGVVRSLMVSAHDRARLIAYAKDFDALMVRYNAAHRGAEDVVFPAARAVVAYTATRWGSLVGPMRASDCYRFVLSHPRVTSCLFAPANRAEMDEALVALERGPMSADELADARRIGDSVRAQRRSAPPFRKREYVTGFVRSIREHGITEDLLSRFNR
ncbi:MAG TPA: aldo/keto reductase [Polyangiaceae bacterium]|jgi:aryl-alcohol dehydrogenase-like predicted oxidoreductase